MEVYAEVLHAKGVFKASALLGSQQEKGSPNLVCNVLSPTSPFISEADQSGWNFILSVFSDYFVLKATFNTSMTKHASKAV